MKTAIFLNTFIKMKNYDLDELSKHNVKLIAITSENEYSKFQKEYGKYFAHIYCSPQPEDAHGDKVNYSFSKNIVQNELKSCDYVRIVCQSEDNLLVAARLRDEFHLPGMSYQETLLFRDKLLMKDAVRKAGIRVPKYKKFHFDNTLTREQHFEKLKEEFGVPFVLKPTKLLGGIGVIIVDSIEVFKDIKEGDLHSLEYEVEEFINGTLYYCDTISQNGEVLFSVCGQESNPNFDFQLGKSVVSISLNQNDPLSKALKEFNGKVLAALGYRTGVSHHEIFVKPDGEIVFLEIGARSPGGIATPMYRLAYNIAYEDTAFKIEMDIPFKLEPTYNRHYMSGILPILPGKVKQLIKPQLSSQFDMQWLVNVGAVLGPCKSLRDKAGTITVWNEDYQILWEDFKYLKNFQCISTSINE
jgi:biotin carboxylase